jgi:cytochrome c5
MLIRLSCSTRHFSGVRCALCCAITFFVVALGVAPALAQTARNGETVVQAVCINCHGTGANGAPKIGDPQAWAPRAARGLTSLTHSAITGIRNMPPHGGNPGVSDVEIERAITYMVNASGGKWAIPIDRTASVERNGEQVVRTYCAACHQEGVSGAPRIGERAAWIPRLRDGFDVLVRSAMNGHGGMPPRGGVANLSDRELAGAISYMLNPVAPAAPVVASAEPNPHEPNHRVINGTDIYFGAVSAEMIRKNAGKSGVERSMHGGIPAGPGFYHVNISLFDAQTKQAIKDARVEARVIDPVHGDEAKMLEPVVFNGTVSYGNYFRLPGHGSYTIAVTIRRSPAQPEILASFQYRAQ